MSAATNWPVLPFPHAFTNHNDTAHPLLCPKPLFTNGSLSSTVCFLFHVRFFNAYGSKRRYLVKSILSLSCLSVLVGSVFFSGCAEFTDTNVKKLDDLQKRVSILEQIAQKAATPNLAIPPQPGYAPLQPQPVPPAAMQPYYGQPMPAQPPYYGAPQYPTYPVPPPAYYPQTPTAYRPQQPPQPTYPAPAPAR